MAAGELRQAIKGRPGWKATPGEKARYRRAGADWHGLVRHLGDRAPDFSRRWHPAIIDTRSGVARHVLGAFSAREAVEWIERQR